MYTNSKQSNNQVDVWKQPQQVKIVRWTKPRPNRDGNGSNRGVEVQSSINGETRWVSLWDGHYLFKQAQWGSNVHYEPNAEPHQRLQLTANNQQTNAPPQTNDPQVLADYYSRLAAQQPQQSLYEQVDNGLYPQNQQSELDYSNPYSYQNNDSQPSQNSSGDINEPLMNQIAMVYSQMLSMAEEICPQHYDPEQKKSVGISMSIAYFRQVKSVPF
jgi:hypothetical protein